MMRMPRRAFNQTVILTPQDYPITEQGGANPEPTEPHTYAASVQPLNNRAADVKVGGVGGSSPQSVTRYDVLIAYADDPVIQAVKLGDEIKWGSKILSVTAPADDEGGVGIVWHIKCEMVN